MSLRFLVVLIVVALCSSAEAQQPEKVPQESDFPVATPIKQNLAAYLEVIKGKVASTWKYPTGVSGTQTLALKFVLDSDGKLVSAEVVDSTDARLNGSAIEAINRAAPFPPIPEDLKEGLAGQPLVMRFSVSSKPRRAVP
jgi:TonB family protein